MKIEMQEETVIGMNVTAMADIVFLLILFFMLATDFTQTDLARLTLPLAVTSQADKNPEKNRLIVNLTHEPPTGVRCDELQFDDQQNLIKLCQHEDHWRIKINIKGELKDVPLKTLVKDLYRKIDEEGNKQRDPVTHISDRALMIRADAGAPYKMLEKVINACAQARVWKLEIGSSNAK